MVRIMRLVFVALVATLLCASCALVASAGSCPRPPLPVAVPDLSALLADELVALDSYLNTTLTAAGVGGFVGIIVYDQQIVWFNGFGKQDVFDPQSGPPTADSIFRIASNTKLFTSLMLFQLSHAGLVDIDESVTTCWPDFSVKTFPSSAASKKRAASRARAAIKRGSPPGASSGPSSLITLRALASHQSGLPRNNPCTFGWCGESEVIAALTTTYQLFAAWARPHYSNIGFSLLGRCIAKIVGAEYEDWIEQNIFSVIGMASSSFKPTTEQMERMATGQYAGKPAVITDYGFSNPNGGIFSTATDMATFLSYIFRSISLNLDDPTDGVLNDFLAPTAVLPDGVGAWGAPWEMRYSEIAQQWLHGKAGKEAGYTSQLNLIAPLKLGVFTAVFDTDVADNTVWNVPIIERIVQPIMQILESRQEIVPLPTNAEMYLGSYEANITVSIDPATHRMHFSSFGNSAFDPLIALEWTDLTTDLHAVRVQLNDTTHTACRWAEDGPDQEIMQFAIDANNEVKAIWFMQATYAKL